MDVSDDGEQSENGEHAERTNDEPNVHMIEDDEWLDSYTVEGDDEEERVDQHTQADNSIARIQAHQKDVFCLAISPNRSYIASGSEDDTVAVWNLREESAFQSPLIHIKGKHIDSVHCLAWNANSNLLASADMAGRILCIPVPIDSIDSLLMIEDCQNGDSIKSQEDDHENSFEQIRWILWHSFVEGILFAGCGDGSIWMWLISKQLQKINVNQFKVFISNSNAPCVSAQLLSDAMHLIAAYEDKFVRLWNLKEANSVEIELKEQCIDGVMDIKEALVAIGCANGETALVSTSSSNLRPLYTFQSPLNEVGENLRTEVKTEGEQKTNEENNSVESVRFAPSKPWLAVGTSNGLLSIFDYERHQIRYRCGIGLVSCETNGEAIINCIWHVGSTDNLISLISATVDGVIQIWDANCGQLLRDNDQEMLFYGGNDEIFSLIKWEDVDKNRVLLFSGCSAGSIRIFQLPQNFC